MTAVQFAYETRGAGAGAGAGAGDGAGAGTGSMKTASEVTGGGNGIADGVEETVVVVRSAVVVVAATEVVEVVVVEMSAVSSEEHPAVNATTAKIAAAEPVRKRGEFICACSLSRWRPEGLVR